MKLCVIDLEQVEARDVGFFIGCLFDDWTFLDNCESGDLHTNNCKLIWPHLPWTGEKVQDKKLAETPFYRDFSHRDMAKRGGHLCLTADHEVLTPFGWTPISSKPRHIMAFSESRSGFEEVTNWIDEEYSGKLHSFEGNSLSALMTPNHRVPYRADQRSGQMKSRRAEEGPGAFMPLGSGWEGGDEVVPARLIAAFMADGSQKSINRIEFHLRKERKIERLKYLCDLYDYEWYNNGDKYYVIAANFPKVCGPFMFEWTRECLQDFVDEYKHWDGHISETAVALFSANKEHLEWIQTFGRILGIGGQIKHSTVKSTFSGTSREYTTEYYILGQNHRQFANGSSIKHTTVDAESTRVFCPTVKSSYFYVRRNGKIFVTGNSNYMGTAYTAARHLKVPQAIMDEFQARYCRGGIIGGRRIEPAFPGIPRYWQWCAEQLQTRGYITTPFGRQRHFFGRPGDDTTLREAIAFLPQSTTADRMNLGLWRVWKADIVQLLAQTYDSITFQYPPEIENEVIPQILELIKVELVAPNGRRYTVPGEAKVGWNWGYYHENNNPKGLRKWKPAS